MTTKKSTHENTMSSSRMAKASQEGKKDDTKGAHLIGNTEAEGHFHRLFQVNSNVLSRTKETLENYLSKRIAQLNSERRAMSTSKQSDISQMLNQFDSRNSSMIEKMGPSMNGSFMAAP